MKQAWMVRSTRTVSPGESLRDKPVILAEIRLQGVPARKVHELHFEVIALLLGIFLIYAGFAL